jgi:hypothetical protein
MNCRHIEIYGDYYLSNTLSPPLRAEFEEHLNGCAPCRTNFERDKKLFGLLVSLPLPNPPEEYWQNLEKNILAKTFEESRLEFIENGIKKDSSIKEYLRFAIPLAAMFILLFSSLLGNFGFLNPFNMIESTRFYSYNIELLGNYQIQAREPIEFLSQTEGVLIMSAPGNAGYGLLIMAQMQSHGRGNDL